VETADTPRRIFFGRFPLDDSQRGLMYFPRQIDQIQQYKGLGHGSKREGNTAVPRGSAQGFTYSDTFPLYKS
jgi:hypothetical protein